MKKAKHTNEQLKNLILDLKVHSHKEKSPFWKVIAKELEKPTRRKRTVNISKLNKVTKKGETIVVPGKVLGNGELNHELTIAAFHFSETAKNKLKNTLTIRELLKKDQKGKNTRIIC
ncbi:50S ribosomal protein L18e [archaeon]|jgi:large subunit ribosomal protein L18e|nr:50S ribosomal protein L18e [archaeon]MBT6824482.1 50S ribosomal protein L18e [archaeon]MBT7106867.1 50S ribosomal protein L18e [archaeon]MBT7297783.1 50S ribosomal protein L18e [archaeon]